MPRVAFISLGCPKNLVDSEQMLGTLASAGCEIVSEECDPDAIIVNTCGFLEASKDESLDVIHSAIARKERGEIGRVVVAGCLVQRHRAKLLDWAPGIDAMVGVFDRDHIVEAVTPSTPGQESASGGDEPLPQYWITGNALKAARERGMSTAGLTVNGADGKGVGYFEDDTNRFRLTPRHWAYLRVSEGCNQKCAFCTIPSIRGKMRSKPLERIAAESRRLMAEGAFELNLIGQDTTSYGYDINPHDDRRVGRGDLIDLLKTLDGVASEFGGGWIRLMYVYPTHFTDDMIDAIASLPNIVKYIDIPLQHISDAMLRSMRRNITRVEQESLLYRLRERIPGLTIRTTLITGFPGETEAHHAELLEFINEFEFDMMGVFRYSPEPGTPAGTMDCDPALHVPSEVKLQREQDLMIAQQRIAHDNARYLSEQLCEFDVLIDERIDENAYKGRCYHQAPQVDSVTLVRSVSMLSPGELVRCTIVDVDGYDLIAQPSCERSLDTPLPVIS